MRKWEASICLTCYTCTSLPRQRVASIRASHFCHLNSLFVAQFEDLVVKISCSKGKWRRANKFCDIFFLKITYLPIRSRYHQTLLMKISWDLVLQDVPVWLFQFLPNRYILLHEVGKKFLIFPEKKKVKILLGFLAFWWYFIRFNSDFGL